MDTDRQNSRCRSGPPDGAAFLLAQLGAHATGLFTERLGRLQLTPAQAGLLRLLARSPGRSQRELAETLGMPPSRFVPFVDQLEDRGLVQRRKNPDDRRLHALYLTEQGGTVMAELRTVGKDHEEQICQALSAEERQTLLALLRRIAQQQELLPGVHPGYG